MFHRRWLYGVTLLALFATAAQAQSTLNLTTPKQFHGTPRRAIYHYATHQLEILPAGIQQAVGPNTVWDASDTSCNYFLGLNTIGGGGPTYDELLDWGDIANNTRINGFDFAYATDHITPLPVAPGTGVTVNVAFYTNENGFNTAGATNIGVFTIPDLPGVDPAQVPAPLPGQFDGWIITVDLSGGGEFTITGADLDGDMLTDWGYSYWIANNGAGTDAGPLIADVGPAPSGMPGAEDAMDFYSPGPGKWNGDPFAGTFFYGGAPYCQFVPGGAPYAQHYMTLYEDDCATSNYGAANNNSTGGPSSIGSQNFPSLSANNFVLTCTGLPANKAGIFFFGTSPLAIPQNISAGKKWIANPVRRLALTNTGTGTVSFAVDFTLPQFAGITANDTLYFQFWHRDNGGISNMSDALKVTVCQ